jgi:GntR family transcriptional regulator of abcA and norABC
MSEKSRGTVDFEFSVNRNIKVSITDQILGYIKMKIIKGDWITGQKLPSQRKLAELLSVNRSTIVEAYSELISLGIIGGKYGRGSEIVNNTWSMMLSGNTPEWNRYIESGIHKANQPTIQTINMLEFDNTITRLSTGEMAPELFPHEMMKKVLDKIPSRAFSLNYIEPLGLLELRKALSKYLKIHGLDVKPSELLIVSGSLQALQLISISILKPGSTVYAEEPSYVNSLRIFQSNGMKMKGIPMDRSGMMPWIYLQP